MTWDPDEDRVRYKELRDMTKVMTELLTTNQASTTTTYPSTTCYYIIPSCPSYDGFDSNKYLSWEIRMDHFFGQSIIYVRGESLEILLVL
jgi:hypothetical protein